MKKIILYIPLILALKLSAQDNVSTVNEVKFEQGSGLNFGFDNNNYQFNIGGFIQPGYTYSKFEHQDAENTMKVNRAYFTVGGKALKEKVSFFIQTDFSLSNPLLDAWVAYHPTSNINVTVGQKRTFLNNREMTINEDKFQFTGRSMLSTGLSNTGREFGVFLDGTFSIGNFGFVPQVALTSGDGRNSFGSDSRDADFGGFKYGGRLDLYPLGFFMEGNRNTTADLLHEGSLKMVVGGAASYNDGASNGVGEGHGDFDLYNEDGGLQYPDYRKMYADILLKYQGFSLLGEYANTSATGLEQTFINQAGTVVLQPMQISSMLVLGDAYNVQLGYATLNGYAVDVRYTNLIPEFKDYSSSLMEETKAYTLGLSKYIKGNSLKIQTALSSIEYKTSKEIRAELLFQIVF
ncbi:porin [Flavobacterium sp. C4GT6]|uniref:porin n=1 Tax=Flavobacterium sp. C4GT6 TaxID=3103818 RepID=UPI002ED0FD60